MIKFLFDFDNSQTISENLANFLSPLLKIILQIKTFLTRDSKVYKEQKFVSYIPANQVSDYDFADKIMVQGAIDLMVINKNNVLLFDYKLSGLKKEFLLKKYKKQLDLYALAIEKAFKKPTIKHLVNIKLGEIYETI